MEPLAYLLPRKKFLEHEKLLSFQEIDPENLLPVYKWEIDEDDEDAPTLPKYMYVAHSWYDEERVDNENGTKFQTIKEIFMNLRSVKYIWIDYSCVDLTIEQHRTACLVNMEHIVEKATTIFVLPHRCLRRDNFPVYDVEYFTRWSWCVFETCFMLKRPSKMKLIEITEEEESEDDAGKVKTNVVSLPTNNEADQVEFLLLHFANIESIVKNNDFAKFQAQYQAPDHESHDKEVIWDFLTHHQDTLFSRECNVSDFFSHSATKAASALKKKLMQWEPISGEEDCAPYGIITLKQEQQSSENPEKSDTPGSKDMIEEDVGAGKEITEEKDAETQEQPDTLAAVDLEGKKDNEPVQAKEETEDVATKASEENDLEDKEKENVNEEEETKEQPDTSAAVDLEGKKDNEPVQAKEETEDVAIEASEESGLEDKEKENVNEEEETKICESSDQQKTGADIKRKLCLPPPREQQADNKTTPEPKIIDPAVARSPITLRISGEQIPVEMKNPGSSDSVPVFLFAEQVPMIENAPMDGIQLKEERPRFNIQGVGSPKKVNGQKVVDNCSCVEKEAGTLLDANLFMILAFIVGGGLAIGAAYLFGLTELSFYKMFKVFALIFGSALGGAALIALGGVLLAKFITPKDDDCCSDSKLNESSFIGLGFALGGSFTAAVLNLKWLGDTLENAITAFLYGVLCVSAYFVAGTTAIGGAVFVAFFLWSSLKDFIRSFGKSQQSKPKPVVKHYAESDLMTNLVIGVAFIIGGGIAAAALNMNWISVQGSYTSEINLLVMIGYGLGGAFALGLGVALAGVLISKLSSPKIDDCANCGPQSFENAFGFLAFAMGGGVSAYLVNTSLINASVGSFVANIVVKAITCAGYTSAVSLVAGLFVFTILFIKSSVQSLFTRPKCVQVKVKTSKKVCAESKFPAGAIGFLIFFLGGALTIGIRYFLVSSESSAEYELVRKIVTYSLYGAAAAWVLGAVIFVIGMALSFMGPKLAAEPSPKTEASTDSAHNVFGVLAFVLFGSFALRFFGPAPIIDRTSIQTLLPGESMNITQYLTSGCAEGTAGCNPHMVLLTRRCNLILAEGETFDGKNTVVWQSNTKQNCEEGYCEGCSVSLDGTTGSLTVQNGAKKLWSSRTPKKTTSIHGTFAASLTSNGVFAVTKGNQTVVTVAHAAATGLYSSVTSG